jgi:hypothetical protein
MATAMVTTTESCGRRPPGRRLAGGLSRPCADVVSLHGSRASIAPPRPDDAATMTGTGSAGQHPPEVGHG